MLFIVDMGLGLLEDLWMLFGCMLVLSWYGGYGIGLYLVFIMVCCLGGIVVLCLNLF